ncbi:AraC family transcriptional regulator, partial [Flavobacterium sp. 9AF]|uniref:helix-turn-helix domain-containing protein n=1 Tax=Flavobacterium sp. 9AF TaxID=2653142 RepID=UPI00135B676C
DINKEVETLKKVIEKENLYTSLWKSIVVIILIFLLIIAFKFYYEKNKANQKVEKLLNEFKANKTIDSSFNMDHKMVIDDDKEKEILEKLKTLIDNKYFLSQDFNQQNVAKKIKTNTTYLSQIVNKNFKKTFREYSNELKINYAIQELINNPTYRKYSTQAIAESVGFKNNVSFTKSFKKRAGVSPAQFIIKINSTE